AGIQHQADIIGVGENAIDERPAALAKLFFTIRVPKEVLAVLADGYVGMHSIAVDPDDGLGQERSGQTHLGSHLAANQLVKLNLVGGGHNFAVAVVNFKL